MRGVTTRSMYAFFCWSVIAPHEMPDGTIAGDATPEHAPPRSAAPTSTTSVQAAVLPS